jgi:hypothetical protein
MATDKSIFRLRFGSNEDLYPTQEELRAFLDSPKKEGGRELHRNDLARYHELLERVLAFGRHQGSDAASRDLRVKMFYGVLGHSQFFNPALKLAVEQFKYHSQAFRTLDFKKPAAFIRSAEEEISGLNPKKKDDAVKMARLRGMVDARKKTLETLLKRRTALTAELGDIARYIRDNLVKIETLCDTSNAVLSDPQTARDEENRSIKDVKAQVKEQLKDALHHGAVTRQQLEAAKKDVALLSKEIADLLREDLSSLSGLYAAIHDHAGKFSHEFDVLMAELGRKKNKSFEEDRELFTRVEQVLVSLISDSHFGLEAAKIFTEKAHENILVEKRKEMLDHLFEQLQKERRLRTDRRTDVDRRRFNEPNLKGPDRRKGKDRRARKDRRT